MGIVDNDSSDDAELRVAQGATSVMQTRSYLPSRVLQARKRLRQEAATNARICTEEEKETSMDALIDQFHVPNSWNSRGQLFAKHGTR